MSYSIWLCSKMIIFFSTVHHKFSIFEIKYVKNGEIFFVSLCTTLPYIKFVMILS